MEKRPDVMFSKLGRIPYLEVICILTVLKLSWSAVSNYSSVGTLVIEILFILVLAGLLVRLARSSHTLLKLALAVLVLAVWIAATVNVDWKTASF